MKRKLSAIVLAGIMVLCLAGCGGGGNAATGAAAQNDTAAQETIVETTAAAEASEAAAETVQTETEAEKDVEESTEAASDPETAAASGSDAKPLAKLRGFGGSLVPAEEAEAPQELSAEEQENMDRAMRAYTPTGDTLLVNNAEDFFYYSQMSKDEQALYTAMLMAAQDPEAEDNIVKTEISIDPNSDEYLEAFQVAYWGMLYDHPELFWLYNATETDMVTYAPSGSGGKYEVYFMLKEPYKNYRSQMKAFNEAVEDFLSDIDLNADDAEIERQIHDKLIDMVTYDTPAMEDGFGRFSDLVHTAYGALVENSIGQKNYAVCDGYSQAFVYLLQQAGINAAVIVGAAGNTPQELGGHAWTVVELDGDWYEVDSTWDDGGTIDAQIEEIKDADELSYAYYKEAMQDPGYREIFEHGLYNITTTEMNEFHAGDNFLYESSDGLYSYSLMPDCFHFRADETTGYESYAPLMKIAPEAKGTKYKY